VTRPWELEVRETLPQVRLRAAVDGSMPGAPGEDLTRSLAGAWSEPGDDRQPLSHVTAARGYLFLGLVAAIRHFG